MFNSKKLIAVAVTAILLVAATPLAAKLNGTWEGYGSGSCYAPNNILIHPWQAWSGTVESGAFEGYWMDDDGSAGGFTGGIIYFYISSEPDAHTMAHCEGTWSWMSPDGLEPVEMGPFGMEFDVDAEICNGTWWSIDNTCFGQMSGERVGE